MVRLFVSYWYILPYKVYYLLQPGACRADLLGNPLGHNSNSIDKAPLQNSTMKLKELGRRAKDFLNIHRTQPNSRLPASDTVHPHTSSNDLSLSRHTSSGVSLAQCSSKLIVWLVPSGLSSRSAGQNPQNDPSSGLDGTNQDTNDLG